MRPHCSVERLRFAVRALSMATRSGLAVLQSSSIARARSRRLFILGAVLLAVGFAHLLPVAATRIPSSSPPVALPLIKADKTFQNVALRSDHGPEGAPPMSAWGAPTASGADDERLQAQAERTVERWMDASGVTGLEVQVSPTGVRHDAFWCQAVWNQGAGIGRADGYGATPSQACATLLTQAVQHYPALARRAVLRGVRLP